MVGLRAALIICLVGGCAVDAPPVSDLPQIASEAVPSRAAQSDRRVPASRAEMSLSFAPVVRRASPAVVSIYTRKIVEGRRSPFADDPFFRQFFGGAFPGFSGRRIQNSLGSGVILREDGIVVSNHHVVAGADEITVVLSDKREFEGEVIFDDQDSDLAVIALEDAENLPILDFRDSDSLEVGDLVLAIGNPFGVGQTVTSGIVSGLARSGGPGSAEPGYLIQTDAAINPGNSGGALVDMDGRLIGINTAILSRSGGSNGIGFAVPANLVARVVEAAIAGARELDRPWLGFDGQTVTGDLAEALGLDRPRGVIVEDLHAESPLAAAGLRPGDVVVALNGDPVESVSGAAFRAATIGTGRAADLTYLRGGAERQARIRLVPAPETPPRNEGVLERGILRGLRGLTVNPAVIAEFGLPLAAEGVLVTGTLDRARRVGLRPGDVVLGINGAEVRTLQDVAQLASRALTSLEIEILRDGRRGTIRLRG